MYETSIITLARHNAHPQDRSDEARRSCDVEVLGAAPDPGGRNLRHARKRRALARPVGDAVGRCRREVARACGDARHGVPPRPPRVSTCRRLARGEADLLDAYVRDACPRRGSREIEGDGRDRNDIRRWRCRSCKRSFSVTTGTIFESHRMPAADWTEFLLEMLSCESLKGIAGSNRRSETTPPCWLARPLAVPAGTRGCVAPSRDARTDERCHRSRARTSCARRTGRSHAGRRGTRSASPSAATGGAGRTPRASAWGNQASPGRGRRMRAISRGAPT